jgi:hypothetical protein
MTKAERVAAYAAEVAECAAAEWAAAAEEEEAGVHRHQSGSATRAVQRQGRGGLMFKNTDPIKVEMHVTIIYAPGEIQGFDRADIMVGATDHASACVAALNRVVSVKAASAAMGFNTLTPTLEDPTFKPKGSPNE